MTFSRRPNMLKHELPTFEIGVVALLATASLDDEELTNREIPLQ
jgi:hypothetical protein